MPAMRVELCLFDIDGTLVDTGGAGMRALQETAAELFGAEGPELDLAGSTDSGIVMDMLRGAMSRRGRSSGSTRSISSDWSGTSPTVDSTAGSCREWRACSSAWPATGQWLSGC
jgi:phosphoglycolate phosphatase-like HAD superfamily hydrolase